MTRILLLGGTTEASALARALSESGADAIFSYAGRTSAPKAQPLPTRLGGFGGPEGLATYMKHENITHVVDATHPFAAQMSHNAAKACAESGVALAALERPPWQAVEGDRWQSVADIDAAVAALPTAPARIFLAIGKQHIARFAARPEHHYLVRLVDTPDAPLPFPSAEAIISRGPFTYEGDLALLRDQRISLIVAKNGGGAGARAKIDAARTLGLPIILIDRPALPCRQSFASADEVMRWLSHCA